MNIHEGARRMRQSGRAMVLVSLSAFVLYVLFSAAYTFLPSYLHVDNILRIVLPLLFFLAWLCALALVVGGALWVAGWILEGFHHTH